MQSENPTDQPMWYIRIAHDSIRGPFSYGQIKEFLQTGRATADTLLSKSRIGPFQPLSTFEAFRAKATPAIPMASSVAVPPSISNAKRNQPNLVLITSIGLGGVGVLLLVVTLVLLARGSQSTKPKQYQEDVATAQQEAGGLDADRTKPDAEDSRASDTAQQAASPGSSGRNSATAGEKSSFEEVVAEVEHGVCIIQDGSGTGSGFLIDDDKVMTNRHVVDGMLVEDIRVIFPSDPASFKNPYKASILYEDDSVDVAVLTIPKVNKPVLTIEAGTEKAFRRGREIIAIGSPADRIGPSQIIENAVSGGKLSSTKSIDGVDYFQLSISINGGNSGGPILGLSGQVLGMVTSYATKVEGIAFAIPAHRLIEILEHPDNGVRDIVSKDELAARNAYHDARVAVNRLIIVCAYNLSRIDRIHGLLDYGVKEHQLEVNDALRIAMDVDAEADHAERLRVEESIDKTLQSVASKRVLDSNIRSKIAELRAVSREASNYADSPRGSINSLGQKYLELRDKAIRLYTELDAMLDLPEIGQ